MKKMTAIGANSLRFIVLFILVFGCDIIANEQNPVNSRGKSDSGVKDLNDPNEQWWKKWDAAAKNPNDPNELLEVKWNSIITVLQNKQLDQELQKKIIDKIISPFFDSELMAKLVLGRTNWPKLTAPQQKKFTELFSERLKTFYLEKIAFYKDEKIKLKPATPNKNNIFIPMVLISSDKEVAILYKLHKLDEAEIKRTNQYWKIYDVEIENISILMTYQSQFDDILRRSGVNGLFEQLEKPPVR